MGQHDESQSAPVDSLELGGDGDRQAGRVAAWWSVLEVKPSWPPGYAAPGPARGVGIAEAARRTGLSAHTLRYYERAGLVITPVDRTAGGRRPLPTARSRLDRRLHQAAATGLPVKAIRRYAELVSGGHGNEQERLALMEAPRVGVLAKLAEVQENLELIDHKIDVYRSRLAAGDADSFWAPTHVAGARSTMNLRQVVLALLWKRRSRRLLSNGRRALVKTGHLAEQTSVKLLLDAV